MGLTVAHHVNVVVGDICHIRGHHLFMRHHLLPGWTPRRDDHLLDRHGSLRVVQLDEMGRESHVEVGDVVGSGHHPG